MGGRLRLFDVMTTSGIDFRRLGGGGMSRSSVADSSPPDNATRATLCLLERDFLEFESLVGLDDERELGWEEWDGLEGEGWVISVAPGCLTPSLSMTPLTKRRRPRAVSDGAPRMTGTLPSVRSGTEGQQCTEALRGTSLTSWIALILYECQWVFYVC